MNRTDHDEPDSGRVAPTGPEPEPTVAPREYDRSGLYPEEGKAFRLWAILGWNLLVVALMAAAAAALNIILL
jgi:hypothetical protein